MVEAQLKVDAIGEVCPIIIAVAVPEPVCPVFSISGQHYLHKAANMVALVAADNVCIRVVRSAVYIQIVTLVLPVQVDGNVIVCIHLVTRHTVDILVCVHGRCRFFPAKRSILFVTDVVPRFFLVFSSGIFQNLGVHRFSIGLHVSVLIHHIHGFNALSISCKLQLLFVDVDGISNAQLFKLKLKAYRIGVSAAHGSLAGVHRDSQRDGETFLPIYVKIALPGLLCNRQRKHRLFLSISVLLSILPPTSSTFTDRITARVCRQAIPRQHLTAFVL